MEKSNSAMSKPLVSIVIPCYNAEKYVGEAIQSALDQTYPDCEVIVIDDGSTDGSLDVIRSFGDRIRWETGPNRGGCAARNRGYQTGSGVWIQFLDADDFLLDTKIERQLAGSASGVPADVIYSPVIQRLETAEGFSEIILYQDSADSDDTWLRFLKMAVTQTSGYLFSRNAVEGCGGWNVDQKVAQDIELCMRILMNSFKFCYLDTPLSVYRKHQNITVSTSNPMIVIEESEHLLEAAAEHLTQSGALTPKRKNAYLQSLFLLCRRATALPSGCRYATHLHARIVSLESDFHPHAYSAASPIYIWAYKVLGFSMAEKIVSFSRKMREPFT